MKKMLLVLAVLSAASALVFAGGGSQGSAPSRGNAAGASGQITEIEFVNMSTNWNPVDFGADPVTRTYMEKTGVKMICSAPPGRWQEVANVWLVSNDYPEMMHMSAGPIMEQYIAAGVIQPINKLAQQYKYPKITNGEYIYPATMAAWTKGDGNFYAVPNWFSTDGRGSIGYGVNVRNDLYNKFGKPAIKTVDDLYNYLVKIRDAKLTSPDGSKLWALSYQQTDSRAFGFLAGLWGGQIWNYMYYDEASKTVKVSLRSTALVNAIKFLNKCYREGLMDPETLSFTAATQGPSFNQGKHGVIIGQYWDLKTPTTVLMQTNPDMYFITVDPPQGTAGVKPVYGCYNISGTSGTMITKKLKNTEAAMRFINYLLSPEGQILDFYGIEGSTMEFKNGEPVLFMSAYDGRMADMSGFSKTHGIRIFDMMMNSTYNWQNTMEGVRWPHYQEARDLTLRNSWDGTFHITSSIDPLTDEGILLADLEANIVAQLTKVILEGNESTVQTMINSLLTEYERKGIAKLEARWTRDYLEKLATRQRMVK